MAKSLINIVKLYDKEIYFVSYVIRLCVATQSCAECPTEHGNTITFTIRQLLGVTFVKISEKKMKCFTQYSVVGTKIVRNPILTTVQIQYLTYFVYQCNIMSILKE